MKQNVWKFGKQHKVTFIGTFLIGILTYFYTMSNHFLTFDSMWNLYSKQDMLSSGRPFLTYACRISSDYDLPAVNGILAIFYLALTAVVLVDIYKIKNAIIGMLMGGMLVTFPSVISSFCYAYTVDGYMLAVLLTTLALWCTERYSKGWIAGIFLSGFGIGIYQAYFSYLIVLCIVCVLLLVLEEEKLAQILKKIGAYAGMGAGGYLFYIASFRGMLAIKQTPLSGYQGTDQVLNFSLAGIPQGMKAAWTSFYQFARWGHAFTTTGAMKVLYFSILVVGVVLYMCAFLQKKRYGTPGHLVLTILCVIALPFGLCVFAILVPDVLIHMLMRFSWVVLFLFVLILLDRMELWGKWKSYQGLMQRVVQILFIAYIFEFAVMANIVAFNMEERYEKTYGLCLRILDRLEQQEEYETGMPVALLGGVLDAEYYPTTSITEEDLSAYFGAGGDLCINSTEKFAEFCKHYLNATITTIPAMEEERLTQTPEFVDMGKFPKETCIQQIEGVWVIKING